jgi:aryl-alcohol dehydrogenase-like predicted oxidoreductase
LRCGRRGRPFGPHYDHPRAFGNHLKRRPRRIFVIGDHPEGRRPRVDGRFPARAIRGKFAPPDARGRPIAMQTTTLGPFSGVSRLTLGGGGLGQLWGQTDQAEAIATLGAAIDGGINLIDTAPLYRDCEAVVGAAFEGALPQGVRITSKCYLGTPGPGETQARIAASLDASLAAMKLERVDLYFLHTNICPDDYEYARHGHRRDRFATTWSTYVDEVIPAMQRLVAQGRIGAWGITGVGVPASIHAAIAHTPKPQVIQAIANLLDSAGGMSNFDEPPEPRAIIAAAKAAGIGVMGIRAVQAGALTAQIDRELKPDHPEMLDYLRAAPFRVLCARWGEDPALVAHRYALAMDGIDTVILGVKNRQELAQCLDAERQGPLEAEQVAQIDRLGLREA